MSETVDSREVASVTSAVIGRVNSPDGPYRLSVPSQMDEYTRYERYGFSVYLNHKLDRGAQRSIELVLANEIKRNLQSKFQFGLRVVYFLMSATVTSWF